MSEYAIYAMLAAVGITGYAILTKVILRYRICSAGYVAFATGAAAALPCVIAITLTRIPFPQEALLPLIIATISGLGGLYGGVVAMQEGDASTVVPVMGVKIPAAALLSMWLIGEMHPWFIYVAAALATAGVMLFGAGPQLKAQGGHDRRPWVGIAWAAASATLYAVSDVYIKLALAHATPLHAAIWNYTFIGLVCVPLMMQHGFRQYKVRGLDVLLLLANGMLLLCSVVAFFIAIQKAGHVTTPNIFFATRSFIALGAGYVLNKALKTPIERQPGIVYVFRVIGAGLLFAAIVISL
jgi:drug/metabolite transporter (DMT)-like permease